MGESQDYLYLNNYDPIEVCSLTNLQNNAYLCVSVSHQ